MKKSSLGKPKYNSNKFPADYYNIKLHKYSVM